MTKEPDIRTEHCTFSLVVSFKIIYHTCSSPSLDYVATRLPNYSNFFFIFEFASTKVVHEIIQKKNGKQV